MRSRGIYRIWKGGFPHQGGLVEELRSILRHSEGTRDIALSQLESDKPYTSN